MNLKLFVPAAIGMHLERSGAALLSEGSKPSPVKQAFAKLISISSLKLLVVISSKSIDE